MAGTEPGHSDFRIFGAATSWREPQPEPPPARRGPRGPGRRDRLPWRPAQPPWRWAGLRPRAEPPQRLPRPEPPPRQARAKGRARERRACPLRLEVGDQVDPIFRLLDADERHLGAGDVLLRALDELVEVIVVPHRLLAAEVGHASRVGEAAVRAGLAAHDAPEVRAGAVRAALLDRVAGLALRERSLARRHVGGRQDRAPVRRRVRDRAAAAALFRDLDHIAGLGRMLRGEDTRRELTKADNGQTRRQDGAGDLVERKVAHNPLVTPLFGRRAEPPDARESRPLLRAALLHATGARATAQDVPEPRPSQTA